MGYSNRGTWLIGLVGLGLLVAAVVAFTAVAGYGWGHLQECVDTSTGCHFQVPWTYRRAITDNDADFQLISYEGGGAITAFSVIRFSDQLKGETPAAREKEYNDTIHQLLMALQAQIASRRKMDRPMGVAERLELNARSAGAVGVIEVYTREQDLYVVIIEGADHSVRHDPMGEMFFNSFGW